MHVFYYQSTNRSDVSELQIDPGIHTLDALSLQLPQGVYTTIRTYHHDKTLFFDRHVDRLENSARLVGHSIRIERSTLRKVIFEAVNEEAGDHRVRITITSMEDGAFGVYVAVDRLILPSRSGYENGVNVATRRMKRDNSEAKVTEFIRNTGDIRQEMPADLNEIVMLAENGEILEGFTSNVFCIRKGILWTAGENILPGITRRIVLDLVRAQGIAVNTNGYLYTEIDALDEVFLTSTSRAVLPVVKIDGRPIGSGKPGSITQSLQVAYSQYIDSVLEPIYDFSFSSSS